MKHMMYQQTPLVTLLIGGCVYLCYIYVCYTILLEDTPIVLTNN